ncbi:MAG: hypothetical protein ABSB95_00810 [Dissulfurispiraceae bacterium]|jgi:hypothetical protein
MRNKLVLFIGLLLIAGIMSGCKGGQKTEFDPGKVVQVWAGNVEAVDPVKASSSATIKSSGWAADIKAGTPAQDIVVLVDGKQISFVPQMSISRPDVAKTLKNDALEKSGWNGSMPASSLGKGKHKLEFYAVLSDKTFAALQCGAQLCEVEMTE